jgi:hypothetical protein
MRWQLGVVAAAVALACSAPGAAPNTPTSGEGQAWTPNPDEPWKLTATVAARASASHPRIATPAVEPTLPPTRRAAQSKPAAPTATRRGTATPAPTANAPATQLPAAQAGPAALPPAAGKPAAPVPTTAFPFHSGGLGLTRAEWERSHGAPTGNSGAAVKYRDGWAAAFLDGNVSRVDWSWESSPVGLPEARRQAGSMLPDDGYLISTYRPDPDTAVERFTSSSLARRFTTGATAWTGGSPGSFVIVYRYRDGADGVYSVTIATGNNP